MPQAETTRGAIISNKHKAICRAGLIKLCISLLLIASVSIAFAQETKIAGNVSGVTALLDDGTANTAPSGFNFANLPSLDSIDAQTDITVFLKNGVPEGLRLAALRRCWIMDTAIRDFKEMAENDWDFNDPKSVPSFGYLGPEIDTEQMVAQLFSEPQRVAAVSLRQRVGVTFFGLALHLL
jgi:hypothetical protein